MAAPALLLDEDVRIVLADIYGPVRYASADEPTLAGSSGSPSSGRRRVSRQRMPARCSRTLRCKDYCRSHALTGFGYHNVTVQGASGFLASSAGNGR
ncbi:MAG: hypothetical protein ACREVY_16095 [Gammaproteobacteria bacterium]